MGVRPLLWYQSHGHQSRSRSNIKVGIFKKWPLQGHSCFTNISCFNCGLSYKNITVVDCQAAVTKFYQVHCSVQARGQKLSLYGKGLNLYHTKHF